MDSYAEHPESLATVKAHREGRASLWSPRDVLIDTLRLIDRVEIEPTALIVAYQLTREPGVVTVQTAVSVQNRHEALGLLSAAAHLLQSHDEP